MGLSVLFLPMNLIGNTWLREKFGLTKLSLSHESFLGTRLTSTRETGGRVIETYPRQYDPKPSDDPLAHIAFGLKYDGTHLELLHRVFSRLDASTVASFVAASPSGRYARQIGFLYEFLTGTTLPLPASTQITGNYVPILDDRYIAAPPIKVTRWHVDDNLLGGPAFSPNVRATDKVQAGAQRDWRAESDAALADTPRALLSRALTYLYAKETRSSFLIEREEPGHDREQRFIAALRETGKVPAADSLSAGRLTALQNLIVDPRYAEPGFRPLQNYVGQTMPGAGEHVHYISPPPELLRSLMAGLSQSTTRLEAVPPSVQAAVTAFQFVFIHPYADGNGRIHRFLLQDVLARRGVVQTGAALPLSATILDDMPGYDAALEDFSQRIMSRARYQIATNGALTLHNGSELAPAWRFPDLTHQVEYVHDIIARTISSLPQELDYLRRYDRARASLRRVVDLPDQRLSSLLERLGDGRGTLSKNKRKQFSELTDDEVQRVQAAYADAFAQAAAPLPTAHNSRPARRS